MYTHIGGSLIGKPEGGGGTLGTLMLTPGGGTSIGTES